MGQMIKKGKALKYFHDHPETEKQRAKKLIDMMDDCVNNALVLASYNPDYKYSVDYKSPPTEDFEIQVLIKEKKHD